MNYKKANSRSFHKSCMAVDECANFTFDVISVPTVIASTRWMVLAEIRS